MGETALFAGRGRTAGLPKDGRERCRAAETVGDRGVVCNGSNDPTDGFYRVKRSGSSERE